jgi:hypothetical protein
MLHSSNVDCAVQQRDWQGMHAEPCCARSLSWHIQILRWPIGLLELAFFPSSGAHSMDAIAIVKESYQAYVDKDRAALEAVIADDFHFTSSLDNRLTAGPISSAAGRIRKRSQDSNMKTS